MRAACSRVLLQKGAFDEQLRRARGQRHDALRVVRVIGDVRHVADLLARHLLQHLGLERAQRDDALGPTVGARQPGAHQRLVGRAARHQILELLEPRPDRQAQPGQAVLPHVDVHFLLDGKTQTGRAVVQKRRPDAKRRLVEQHAVVQLARAQWLGLKARVAAQPGATGLPVAGPLPRPRW